LESLDSSERSYFEHNVTAIKAIYPGIGRLLRSLPCDTPQSIDPDDDHSTQYAEQELKRRWSPQTELHIVDRCASNRLAFQLFDKIHLAELEDARNRRLLLMEDRPERFRAALEHEDWRTLLNSEICLLAVDYPQGNVLPRLLNQYPDISNAEFEIYAGDETVSEERRNRIQDIIRSYRQAIRLSFHDCHADMQNTKKPPFPKTIRFFVAGHNYLQDACVCAFRALGYGAERLQWKNPLYRFVRSSAWLYDYRRSHCDTVFLLNTTPRLFTRRLELEHFPLFRISWFVDHPRRYAAHSQEYEGCDVIGVFDRTYIPSLQACTVKPVIEVRTGFGIDASQVHDRESFADIDVAFVGELGLQGVQALEEGLTCLSPELVSKTNEVLSQIDIRNPVYLAEYAEGIFRERNREYRGAWVEFLENKATSLRRRYFLETLANQNLHIFGDQEWANPSFAGPLTACYAGRRVDYFHELPNLYATAKINLNIFHVQCVAAPNPRVYDVMACGGFLLTEYNPGLEDEFEIDKDLAVFRTRDELREKAEYYLAHPEARMQIAARGQAVTLAKCGYHDRMQHFLSSLI
jgi:hypothetical protein